MLKESILKKWTTDVVVGDYSDKAAMEQAFEWIERVYLVSPPSQDQFTVQTALVDIAKRRGVNHIVKLSALGTSSESPVGLLRAHAEIEEYIRKSGVAWTFLHAHYFMENLLMNVGECDSERSYLLGPSRCHNQCHFDPRYCSRCSGSPDWNGA